MAQTWRPKLIIRGRPGSTGRPSSRPIIKIPGAELNRLALAHGHASLLADKGAAPAGFECLNTGLESALQLPVDTAWRGALIRRWREACDHFAEKHGIRLG